MSDSATVDELITVIRYEMDAHSKAVLEQVDKASEKATGRLNLQNKAMRTVSGATGRLTDLVKSLGIASGVTSGIMAAWSINAGKEATRLTNLSQSTQVSIKDIQQLGSVYEQVGGDAKSFAQDAATFFNTYGKKLDVGAMKELAKTFSTMAPDMAQHLGRAYGFSDDMIRVLMKGPEAIQAMTEKAEKLGHTVSEKDIAALNEMNISWESLKSTVSATALTFQAGISPVMKDGFEALTEAISKNREAFRLAGETLGGYGETLSTVIANLIDGRSVMESFYAAAKMTPEETKKNAQAVMAKGDDAIWTEQYKEGLKSKGYSEKEADVVRPEKTNFGSSIYPTLTIKRITTNFIKRRMKNCGRKNSRQYRNCGTNGSPFYERLGFLTRRSQVSSKGNRL